MNVATLHDPTIQIRDLHQTYTTPREAVLRGVDLDIAPGEFVTILGRSGMGKSTLLRCLNGFVKPFQGSLKVFHHDLSPGLKISRRTLTAIRRDTAVIFQQANLVKRLSVLNNVLTGMLAELSGPRAVIGAFKSEQIDRAHELLETVGLAGHAHKRADELSGGQQQRVGIARALAQRPKLILADEPVASLDPVTSVEILSLLKRICHEDGITVIVSLHQIEYTRQFGERVIALGDGRLALDTSADELHDDDLSKIYAQVKPHNDKQGPPNHLQQVSRIYAYEHSPVRSAV